ncbi:MAG: hypothetical protein ACKE8G_03575 [Methylophagaceae bacterium]
MADDVEVNADEGGVDKAEDSEETEGLEEKTGFFKSKLFLIIAGVITLLLLAGGGYYFFAPSEELEIESEELTAEILEETGIKTNEEHSESIMSEQMGFGKNILEPEGPVDTNNDDIATEIISEESATELIEMQKQINDLEAKINQQEKIIQDQYNIESTNGIAPIRNSNSVDYQQDLFDDASMREPNRTPPPKPNWGEFDRINKK